MKHYFKKLFFCLVVVQFLLSCGDETSPEPSINQSIPPYMPGENISVKEDILLPIDHADASSTQPQANNKQNIESSFDNDLTTWWHSNWTNTAPDYFPITVNYYFKNIDAIDYLIYTPRKGNGDFGLVEFQVSTKENPDFVTYITHDFNKSNAPSRVNLGKTAIHPVAIRLLIKSGAGNFASCAEIAFYKKGEMDFDPLTIFKDMICTELKSGITEKEINAVSSSFFRNLGLAILNGVYPMESRLQEYQCYPHPDICANKYKISPYSLCDNPTGISIGEGDQLVVMTGDLHGQSLSLLIQNLEPSTGFVSDKNYQLMEGVNIFKAGMKGLIYVMYYSEDGSKREPVKIHIASGKVNGVYRRDGSTKENKKEDWIPILNKAVDKHIDVVGKHAHLTFPVEDLKTFCKDGTRLIEVIDSIVILEQKLENLNIPNNRMYLQVSYKTADYMYASSYRTVYQQGTMKDICDPEKLHSVNIWGPAHEMGHMHQTRPGFKWHGMTEVTNNINSLFVQTNFGNPSDLMKTRPGASLAKYNSVYELALTRIMAAGKGHNELTKPTGQPPMEGEEDEAAAGNEVFFMKLVPFWQLQLYYGNMKGKDFYPKLYKLIREAADPTTDGKAQLAFTVKACEAAGEDLTQFFRAWGFFKPMKKFIADYGDKEVVITQSDIDATLTEIAAKHLPEASSALQYITDGTVGLFKNPAAVQKGSVVVDGSRISTLNWKNAVAFKVYSGDKTVFISTNPDFVLDGIYDPALLKIVAVAADGTETIAKIN